MIRVVSANMDFAARHDRDYLALLCENADVLLLQEAKTFRLADLLPEGWVALQDTTDPGRMGSCIAYRAAAFKAATPLRLSVGARPFVLGRRIGMLTRWIAEAHLIDTEGRPWHAVSAHLPPKRFAALQPGMARRLRRAVRGRPWAVVGTDANQPIDDLADLLGMKAYGVGIVGILAGPRLTAVRESRDRRGLAEGWTDHPAIRVTLTRKDRP